MVDDMMILYTRTQQTQSWVKKRRSQAFGDDMNSPTRFY